MAHQHLWASYDEGPGSELGAVGHCPDWVRDTLFLISAITTILAALCFGGAHQRSAC